MYNKSHYFNFLFKRSQIINITSKNVQCAIKHNEQGNTRNKTHNTACVSVCSLLLCQVIIIEDLVNKKLWLLMKIAFYALQKCSVQLIISEQTKKVQFQVLFSSMNKRKIALNLYRCAYSRSSSYILRDLWPWIFIFIINI